MGHAHRGGFCAGCGHGATRREFVRGCGAALAAAGGLAPGPSRAEDKKKTPVRIGLVFLSTDRPSWPSPEFDVAGRQKEILALLSEGCPGVEFVPVAVHSNAEANKATALKDRVDGYLVYIVTLAWRLRGALMAVAKLGKPLIVADEYLGGSGLFLTGYSALRRAGIPAVGVASTRPGDLVVAARCFASLREPGTTPASFAKRCQQAYRKTFPPAGELECRDDEVSLTDIGKCVERFRQARFLIVGRGHAGRKHDFLGAEGIYVGFDELKALYEKADREEAAQWADRWIKEAEQVVEAKPDWIRKAAAIYLATRKLCERYETDTVTMNCLGGFASGRLPAYPCLGFMQILNDGGHGVCEAMPDDTLSMLIGRILTGRPGYVSDPVLDTAKNQVVYAHCVATTKVFGPDGEANSFRIRTLHNHDPRGTCAQSFLPKGYMTTSFRTSFRRKQMVIHRAKAVGNLDSPRGCRTQLVGEVSGDIGNLFGEWDRFGWHRVTVYGDVKEPLIEFAKALGLAVVEEG
ncbi:MAG: twin-arginine translocation signal domain-containing protein [Planctomycetota bacterium]